ncbi:M16 family metallopeptidase [Pseudohongiella spirulinae]|uniref:Peptidase M16-like n=1 Tax=Pseudohongiella spirulinae TaxID=1249552 RepID=A0A0S2KB92_9GAMM|nr:pitrilysin family protein [Pseudohongiella spirulinae]ALO45263.1 Peptidase M16-like [Pseudohongiella spirulinae]
MQLKNILSLLCLLALLSSGMLSAQQKPWEEFDYPPINSFDMPALEIFELGNGIRFYLVQDSELPLINLTALIRSGGVIVPDDKVGLHSIVGTVMRSGGSLQYPGDVLNELLEDQAAIIEAGFGFTSGTASMNVLSDDFAELLPVFVDVLTQPVFPEDRLQLALTQQRSSIARRNDDQAGVAGREFQRVIYGQGSPYSRRVEYATLNNISRQDLIDFHRQAVVGENLMIGVSGDFELDVMKDMLREAFADIPAGQQTDLQFPPVDYDFESGVYFVDKSDVNQSYVLLGHIGGMRDNPDYAALQVMNRVLSGGFSSRLMQVVRSELGLAYSVSGSYGSGVYFPGTFTAAVMTQSSTTAQAIEAIIGQIERLQDEPISTEELAQTKDQFLNTLVFQYPSVSSVLQERMSNDYAGLPVDTFERLVDDIRQVTIEDVQDVARRYLRPDAVRILVVGNGSELGDQLDSFGHVQSIDITIPQ